MRLCNDQDAPEVEAFSGGPAFRDSERPFPFAGEEPNAGPDHAALKCDAGPVKPLLSGVQGDRFNLAEGKRRERRIPGLNVRRDAQLSGAA